MTSDPALPPALQGAVRLDDWGVISATGADAAAFLHGQLTQDFSRLVDGQARLAGYCSPKGRLLASFVAWRDAPPADRILLACSADVLAPVLKRLSMFVMRAKCKLADASDEVALFGLAGPAAAAWLGAPAATAPWETAASGGARVIALPPAAGVARWLLAHPASFPAPPLPALGAEPWRWLEVRSGIPRIVAATVEQFVPQMVNLELVGGVSFQKGCYPGQEVVARSQYRGTLKRRMQAMQASGPLLPGQDVFHTADPGQPAGMVVLAAPGPDGRWSALVELKLGAWAISGELHCGEVRLQPGALPYEIPAEAA